jgi:glycosyltransferase involved in cell wall biosynthesis
MRTESEAKRTLLLEAASRRDAMGQRSPLKIVHIITNLNVGGAEMMLYRLIRESRRAGVQHIVISLSADAALKDRVRELGAEVRVLGMSRGIPNPLLFGVLVAWLARLEPDIVQTWMYHADLLGSAAVGAAGAWRAIAGRRRNRPVLVWGIHHTDLLLTGSSRLTKWIARWCALASSRVPDAIVCCAQAALTSHVGGGYCARRMKVVHNGFDLELFRPSQEARHWLRALLGLGDTVLLVGIMGRFHAVKDYRNFLAAARIVRQRLPGCHFVMTGHGLDSGNRELHLMIDASGIAEACHLLGPRDDPQRFLAGLDVFCLSSKSEGLPTVIGEAMACEVPCAATDVGDTALLIGDTGKVVPPRNPEALANALIAMLELSAQDRAALGERARQRIREHFSMEACWRQYEQIYASALANAAHGREPASS